MLKIGKLDSDLLKRIVFEKITCRREEVITRPGIGEDCAVVDFGSYNCVMSTDPITAAVSEIGNLAIHITCNDIASNGVEPLGIMIAAMLPEGTTEDDIENIMEQAGKTAAELNVEIIGGHTEITGAVNKPVIVSTAIGRGPKDSLNDGSLMKEGDKILLTKRAGLEGAGIIASDLEAQLMEVLTEEELAEAKGFLKEVSVVKEGVAAGKIGTHGMHDVTEGGVFGAVWEMCQVADLGCEIYQDEIPVDPVTVKIANHFGIDYLRLISSGCMIIIAAAEKADKIQEVVSAEGVEICCIGNIKAKEFGVKARKGEELYDIAPPESDELYRAVK